MGGGGGKHPHIPSRTPHVYIWYLHNVTLYVHASSIRHSFASVQALERELAPVEERLSKLGRMTRKVTASNPREGSQVQARHSEIAGLWDKLKVLKR